MTIRKFDQYGEYEEDEEGNRISVHHDRFKKAEGVYYVTPGEDMKSEDQYNRAQEKHHPIRSNFGNVLAVGIGLLLILFPLWGLQEANRRMEKPIKIELPNK